MSKSNYYYSHVAVINLLTYRAKRYSLLIVSGHLTESRNRSCYEWSVKKNAVRLSNCVSQLSVQTKQQIHYSIKR